MNLTLDSLLSGAGVAYHERAGPIGLIHVGDSISIDAHQLLLQLIISDAELDGRRSAWRAPAPRYTRGVLAKFARLANSASKGAVTDAFEF